MTPLTWVAPPLPEELWRPLTGPGAPFEIVTEDVFGVPMEVFSQRARTVLQWLDEAAEAHRDRPYLVFHDRSLTYGEVAELTGTIAANLSARLGVAKGDRVAVAAANCMEYALAFWAATRLGAITVAMNGWWTGPEMAYAIELTEPTVILGDRRRLERLDDAATKGAPVVSFEEDFPELEEDRGISVAFPELDEDDTFVILFTSGTTGRPKGVELNHRGTIHFCQVNEFQTALGAALGAARGIELPPAGPQCLVACAPLFHVGGLNCSLVMAPVSGTTQVYTPPGRWREDAHLELTERHQATRWSLVPTQLWRLLEWPELERYDLSSLSRVGGGSAVWPPELLRRLEERLPWVRPGLGMGYGMTETVGFGTSLGGPDTYEHPDSIGRPAPTVALEIRDPVTHKPLPEGEVGEIALRSATNFPRYWRNPEATTKAFDADRWYHTGDFGHVTAGFVYLEGRRQDLIIRGGENIYPAEIENRLIEHQSVDEVAVVGVPHPILGQEVKAYVVLRPGETMTPDEVGSWCATSLAGFKVPTQVEFLDQLPHNATGKVLKHLLGKEGGAPEFIEE